MKNLLFLLLFFLCLFFSSPNKSVAQTRTIKGLVINALTNKPMRSIKVEIKGSNISTKTNAEGKYTLEIPDTTSSVIFSDFVGLNLVEQSNLTENEYNLFLTDRDIFDLSLIEMIQIQVNAISRFSQSADRAPNSVIVLNEQQIEARGYQDLSDVLKDIPGFDISDNASRFGEYYTLRGIQGNERILVLIDGHKLNPPTGTLLSVGNSISVRFAKQIEIIYGPSSAMFGADAYSGIINIISKDNSEGNSITTVSGSFASLSSVDAMFESRFKVNDDFSFSVFGRMFRSDGFDVVGTDSIYNIIKRYKPPYSSACEQPIEDFTFFVRSNYKNFSLGYFRQMFDEGNAYTLNPDKNVYIKDNHWQSSTDNIWLSYKNEVGNLGTLTCDVNAVYFKLDNTTQFTKWVKAYKPDTLFHQFMTGKDLSLKATATLHKKISPKFQYIVGLDYENIKSIPPYANDQLFGNSYKYEGVVADSIDKLLTLHESRIAAFGQMIWSPHSTFDLVIGGRYDYSSRYQGTFNPRAGFTFRPFEKTTCKFIYGTAFQAPSLFFQYEQWGSSTTVMLSSSEVKRYLDPSWELKNQLVSTYELSVSQQIGKSFQIKASAYYNYLTDIIQRVTTDTVAPNKYYQNILSPCVRNENVGVQKIRGFNTELNFVITGKLEAYAYYCYTDGVLEEKSGDMAIPRISENKIWVGATYNNLFQILTVSPRVRWAGEINSLNKAKFPSGKQPGYTTIDLAISANRIFGIAKVYVVFNNLLNQKIEHAGLYQQTGGYLPTITQEQLRVKFGVEVNFGR